MTQEELDALMAGDINNLDEVEENSNEESEQNVVEEDDNKKGQAEIQNLTDENVASTDEIVKNKSTEIEAV